MALLITYGWAFPNTNENYQGNCRHFLHFEIEQQEGRETCQGEFKVWLTVVLSAKFLKCTQFGYMDYCESRLRDLPTAVFILKKQNNGTWIVRTLFTWIKSFYNQ